MKTTFLAVIGALVIGAGTARAQDPPTPPPTPPPATQPPVTTPPPVPVATPEAPVMAAPAEPKPAARVELTEPELRRRRNAIFMLEGMLGNAVTLAASETQHEIQERKPDLTISLFSPVPPSAQGNYLEDYGVFFQVRIPTYIPTVVNMIETLSRSQARGGASAAQPMALTSPLSEPLNPDALYVHNVRASLVTAMLEYSKGLELRAGEFLTVSARGDDGLPGQIERPSIMVLRVKGSDLADFLAGRLTRQEVEKRIEIRGYSSR